MITVTVPATDMHVGDVLHQSDWRTHVRSVDNQTETGGGVVFVTDEFPKLLQHRRADETVEVDR